MTYIQAFDKIKEKLDGKAKISHKNDSFAVQVTLTNKDSHGIFYLKYSDGFLDVQPYDYYDNDAAVSLSYQTFLKLTDGRLSLDDALSKGLIEIFGNHSAAEAICGIVPPDKPDTVKNIPQTPKATEKRKAVGGTAKTSAKPAVKRSKNTTAAADVKKTEKNVTKPKK